MNSILKRLLPIAFIALAMTATMHAPASAETTAVSLACGNINLSTASNAEATKSFDCFSDAFKRCDSASLEATGRDGDAALSYTFTTIDGDHGCRIVELVERTSGNTKTSDTYLCSSISRDQGGLSFSGCGSQRNVALKVGQVAGPQTPASNQAQLQTSHGDSRRR